MSIIELPKPFVYQVTQKIEFPNCVKVHYKVLVYKKVIKHQEKSDLMQTQAVYYEHKINVFIWLIIWDQYSAEHKWILNFGLSKDLFIYCCICPKKLILKLAFNKFGTYHKYRDKINTLHVLYLLMLVPLKNHRAV